MPVITIVGAQWGDEGKGKIVDLLTEKAQMVVRFSGGDNAGHTIVNQYGNFGLHLVPSGIFYAQVTCVIGNGVVINPKVLLGEIDQLKKSGVDTGTLFISDRAHLIMPYHLCLDGLEEKSRGGQAIGTTRKGIGPAFADKVARLGIRVGDLMEPDIFRKRLEPILAHKNTLLTRIYDSKPLSLDEIYEEYCRYGERLKPMVRETTSLIISALERGETVIMEGAQGSLLDPDFGTYPYTTSSSPLSGNSGLGSGLGPTHIDHVLGIFKAYCTRVGAGPMPTELHDDTGNFIRERAHEFGTTTGRPRRCGWFDAVAARFTSQINGLSSAVITRLDVLDDLPEMKICTHYTLDGERVDIFPASVSALARCQPVYETIPGWQSPTSAIRNYEDLPQAAKNYLGRLEEIIGCPISIVSVGARREETIHKMMIP